jgi:hypothetical protein
MDVLSSSGIEGETPALLDPADRTVPDLWTDECKIYIAYLLRKQGT